MNGRWVRIFGPDAWKAPNILMRGLQPALPRRDAM
jgi:hypothetical protein